MPKFATAGARPMTHGPIVSGDPALTATGGVGVERDAKSELFLLAVSNLVGEDTFHEKATSRDARYAALVAAVTVQDPAWIAALVPYLRKTLHLRSVSVVTAAEYVAAGGPGGRAVIAAALDRADEPAEMLAYWLTRHGRKIPQPVKRGVADATLRLYNERALLRYDGGGRPWRFADVIDLVHPKPSASWQSDLFRHALDRRHGHADTIPESLAMLRADADLLAAPETDRRALLGGHLWNTAGWSWERLSGWLPGGMDRQAWEAVIPTMGYMALLRNLRNFDQSSIGDGTAHFISTKLADAAEVVRSRQLPIRFYSAYREIGSLRWAGALERALDLSLGNIPRLRGRTLILIDVSGSMQDRMSARSERKRVEIAATFGVALAKACEQADTIVFDSRTARVDTAGPLLRVVEEIGRIGGGATYTMAALREHYAGHDRVVILTDEQAHDAGSDSPDAQVYVFNLAGYRVGVAPERPGWHTFGGGLSDACFALLATLDSMRDAGWPHLVAAG